MRCWTFDGFFDQTGSGKVVALRTSKLPCDCICIARMINFLSARRSFALYSFGSVFSQKQSSNCESLMTRRVRTSTVLEGFTCAGELKYFGDDRLELIHYSLL